MSHAKDIQIPLVMLRRFASMDDLSTTIDLGSISKGQKII